MNRPTVVAVVGGFNAGKSSLINALLGQQVLPEDCLPCTNGLFWVRHVSASTQRLPISMFGRDAFGAIRFPDGAKVELRLDLESLLEFEFIDTPGAASVGHEFADAHAREAILMADLVVYCCPLEPRKATERDWLRGLDLPREKTALVATQAGRHKDSTNGSSALRVWESMPCENLERFSEGFVVELVRPASWAFLSQPAWILDGLRRMRDKLNRPLASGQPESEPSPAVGKRIAVAQSQNLLEFLQLVSPLGVRLEIERAWHRVEGTLRHVEECEKRGSGFGNACLNVAAEIRVFLATAQTVLARTPRSGAAAAAAMGVLADLAAYAQAQVHAEVDRVWHDRQPGSMGRVIGRISRRRDAAFRHL